MKKKRISISGILIIILSILFVFLLAMGIARLKEEFQGYTSYDEQSFSGDLKYQDYGSILRKTSQNEARGAKSNEILEEYYALARYYEAAVNYRLYTDSRQTEKAAAYKTVMKQKEKEMGQLQSEIPAILDILSIK